MNQVQLPVYFIALRQLSPNWKLLYKEKATVPLGKISALPPITPKHVASHSEGRRFPMYIGQAMEACWTKYVWDRDVGGWGGLNGSGWIGVQEGQDQQCSMAHTIFYLLIMICLHGSTWMCSSYRQWCSSWARGQLPLSAAPQVPSSGRVSPLNLKF